MKGRSASIKEIIKALLLLAIIVMAAVWLVGLVVSFFIPHIIRLAKALSSLDAAIVVALVTGMISILAVVIGSIVNNVMQHNQIKQEYLRKHREKPYAQLVSLFYDFQMQAKTGTEFPQEELLSLMNEFNKELTLWGSSEAIRMWGRWRVASADKQLEPKQVLFEMEKVIIQLRKDMGQDNKTKQGDILRLTVNDVDEIISG